MRQLDSTSTRVPTNTAPSRSAEPVSGYAIGDLVRLTCESPAHGGAFVARSEKGVVFVRHALTGETVQARITDIGPKNRYYFADAVAIDTPSPARREHPWVQGNSLLTDEERAAATGVKELLGGMEYGHIDPATQRAYKTDTLRTQLIRLGGISPDSPLITSLTVEPMPTKDLTEGDLSWRSRVRYTVVKTPSGWRIGMYPHQSSRAVPVIDFPLARCPSPFTGRLRSCGGTWRNAKFRYFSPPRTGQTLNRSMGCAPACAAPTAGYARGMCFWAAA